MGTGRKNSARYCYAVWLRHFVIANKDGILLSPPKVVVELGPGDSIGIAIKKDIYSKYCEITIF